MEVLDGVAVAPGRDTYSERVAECGCRGVPDGQHIAGCRELKLLGRKTPRALHCRSCNHLSADVVSGGYTRCGICGSVKT